MSSNKAAHAALFMLCTAAAATALSITPSMAGDANVMEVCKQADESGTPLPSGTDCTEYSAQLDQQSKRVQKLLDIKKNVLLIKESEQTTVPPPSLPAVAAPNNAPPPAMPSASTDINASSDRALEVFGDKARITWGGKGYEVKRGTLLPGGAKVTGISLESVDIVSKNGNVARRLPFYIDN